MKLRDQLIVTGSAFASVWIVSLLPLPNILRVLLGVLIWFVLVGKLWSLFDAEFRALRREEKEREKRQKLEWQKELLARKKATEHLPYAVPGLSADTEWALWENCLRQSRRRRRPT